VSVKYQAACLPEGPSMTVSIKKHNQWS